MKRTETIIDIKRKLQTIGKMHKHNVILKIYLTIIYKNKECII